MKISIIIPAYNEHKVIQDTLSQFDTIDQDTEIFVIDQSSGTQTQAIVSTFPKVIYAKSIGNSRASTMNHGAKIATGDILLFLHADCLLPKTRKKHIQSVDTNHIRWGGFKRSHSPSLLVTRITDFGGAIFAKYFGYLLGDNAIWVTRELFDEVGGYREEPLFEDIHLCEKLRKNSSRDFSQDQLQCSSRKFITNGPRKTFFLMFFLQVAYRSGAGVERLAKIYKRLHND